MRQLGQHRKAIVDVGVAVSVSLVIGFKKKPTWRCNSSCDAQQHIDVSEASLLQSDCQGRSKGFQQKRGVAYF